MAAAKKAYSSRPDYETFARMTAYMMKAAGPSGRLAMLGVQSDRLDARSRTYYEKIQPAIVATSFEALSRQFGPGNRSPSHRQRSEIALGCNERQREARRDDAAAQHPEFHAAH